MHVPVGHVVELSAGGGRSPRGSAGEERDGTDRALAAAAFADVRHLGPKLLRPEADLGTHRVHHLPLDLHQATPCRPHNLVHRHSIRGPLSGNAYRPCSGHTNADMDHRSIAAVLGIGYEDTVALITRPNLVTA